MDHHTHFNSVNYLEIQQRAGQLRAEAAAYGISVARNWIALKWTTMFHNKAVQTS